MSTLAYAAMTARREEATPGTSTDAAAVNDQNPKAGKPGVGKWVDTAAALVPAEVLAVHLFLIQQVTDTKQVAGKATVTISNKGNAQVLFWVLVGLSMAIYVAGRWGHWDGWDFVRVFIPPAAFLLWSALQSGTAFDAVADWSEFTRYLVGVVGVIVLGTVANRLAYKADQKTT